MHMTACMLILKVNRSEPCKCRVQIAGNTVHALIIKGEYIGRPQDVYIVHRLCVH